MASQAGGWLQRGFMTCWPNILQPNFLCHVLVRRRFVLVCPFPALQIPNFKTAAVAYESDFIFQSDFLAKILGQDETTLAVRSRMLSPGMQLSQEDAAITRGNLVVHFRVRAH